MNLGCNRHIAIKKIGTVVMEEIYDVLKKREIFNEVRFVGKLLTMK